MRVGLVAQLNGVMVLGFLAVAAALDVAGLVVLARRREKP
jgi:hypothetical protein